MRQVIKNVAGQATRSNIGINIALLPLVRDFFKDDTRALGFWVSEFDRLNDVVLTIDSNSFRFLDNDSMERIAWDSEKQEFYTVEQSIEFPDDQDLLSWEGYCDFLTKKMIEFVKEELIG